MKKIRKNTTFVDMKNVCSIIIRTLNIKHEFDLIVDLSKHDRFAISFHFIDLFITNRFIARNTNMQKMKRNLFSNNISNERKIYIFYDFDEIEKTQLIVVYFKKHHNKIWIYHLTTFSKFQNYINTKLRNILIVYFEKIEQMIYEIDFLIFYIKNFNIIIQSTLIVEIIKNEQNVNAHVIIQSTLIVEIIKNEQNPNAHAKSTIIIAKNFSNNCQMNRERDFQNKSIFLNHNLIFKLITIKFLRRTFSIIMQNSNKKTMKIDKT